MAKKLKKSPLHPLVQAVVDMIPAKPADTKVEWSAASRRAFVRVLCAAFDSVYGPVGLVEIGGVGVEPAAVVSPTAAETKKALLAENVAANTVKRFFIDKDGYARRDPGGFRIMPGNLNGEILYDDRGEHGDLGSIIWSDDSRGVLGKGVIEISATPDLPKVAP